MSFAVTSVFNGRRVYEPAAMSLTIDVGGDIKDKIIAGVENAAGVAKHLTTPSAAGEIMIRVEMRLQHLH